MKSEKPELVVMRDRRRVWVAIVVCLGMALFEFDALFSHDNTGLSPSDFDKFLISLTITGFLVVAFLMRRTMLLGTPLLRVDHMGVVVGGAPKIGWDEIASVKERLFRPIYGILIRLHDPEKHRPKRRWYNRRLVGPGSAYHGPVASFVFVSPDQRPSVAEIESHRPVPS